MRADEPRITIGYIGATSLVSASSFPSQKRYLDLKAQKRITRKRFHNFRAQFVKEGRERGSCADASFMRFVTVATYTVVYGIHSDFVARYGYATN